MDANFGVRLAFLEIDGIEKHLEGLLFRHRARVT